MHNFFNFNILKQKFELIYTITHAQMKSRYRKTFAGFFWVLLNPILSFCVQAIIFKHVLKIDVSHYYLFLLSGLIPWIFITSSLTMTVGIFIANRSTLMAFKIDPWIFLVSQLLDNFINFIASYLILILIVDSTVFLHFWIIPLFILSTLLLILFVFSLSFLLATLNVFYRDTQFILSFVLNLAYFITPIFYQKTLLPLKLQNLVELNPLYIFIKPFHHLIWEYNTELFWQSASVALITLFILAFASITLWRRKRDALYFNI